MAKITDEDLDYFEECVERGRALGDSGALVEAIACYDVVLERLPRRSRNGRILYHPEVFTNALMGKSFCLLELEHYKEAIPLLERACELDPANSWIFAELGYAQGNCGQSEPARNSYRIAAYLEPNNPNHLHALAHLAIRDGDYKEARRLIRLELKLESDNTNALNLLSYAEYMLGNINTAIRCLRRILCLIPDDRSATLQLVVLLREVGRPVAALKLLMPYVCDHLDDEDAHRLMKELELELDNPKMMVKHARTLLEINPEDIHALDLISWGYFRLGKMQLALQTIQQLTELNPTDASNYFKIAMMQQSLGNITGAMTALQRCLILESPGTELAEAAQEAIEILDRRQLEKLFELMGNDENLRDACYMNPVQTLLLHGYALSPMGWEILHKVLHDDDEEKPRRMN